MLHTKTEFHIVDTFIVLFEYFVNMLLFLSGNKPL